MTTFVVYNIESTHYLRVFRNRCWQDAKYSTKGAATAALNRAVKESAEKTVKRVAEEHPSRRQQILSEQVHAKDYAILSYDEFKKIEKTEVRRSLLPPHTEHVVTVNTPWTSGPWSETYLCS